jgi:hypothetical protein
MRPRTWVLRSGEFFWSPVGWTPHRESAERFDSLEDARRGLGYLDTDRECVPVRIVGAGDVVA